MLIKLYYTHTSLLSIQECMFTSVEIPLRLTSISSATVLNTGSMVLQYCTGGGGTVVLWYCPGILVLFYCSSVVWCDFTVVLVVWCGLIIVVVVRYFSIVLVVWYCCTVVLLLVMWYCCTGSMTLLCW